MLVASRLFVFTIIWLLYDVLLIDGHMVLADFIFKRPDNLHGI